MTLTLDAVCCCGSGRWGAVCYVPFSRESMGNTGVAERCREQERPYFMYQGICTRIDSFLQLQA